MWVDEKDKTTLHNGALGYNQLGYSYVLNEIVDTYVLEVDDFSNYEVFFDYVKNKFRDIEWFKAVYERAKNNLVKDKPYLNEESEHHSHYLFIFNRDPDLRQLIDIFNYLISDMLNVSNVMDENSRELYDNFINYIQKYKKVDIFTLNHDLLLEKLLSEKYISFCRGFSIDNSDVYYEEEPLPVFNNFFKDKINIHKLHGSIDFFKFQHCVNDGGLFWTPTDNYSYFVTHGYRSKHYAVRVNPTTKETVQNMNFDVTPQFITGINKMKIIENDTMYSQLFNNFKSSIKTAVDVLISGYSYSDTHINRVLEGRNDINVINQNPRTKYPFKSKSISELESLKDLGE